MKFSLKKGLVYGLVIAAFVMTLSACGGRNASEPSTQNNQSEDQSTVETSEQEIEHSTDTDEPTDTPVSPTATPIPPTPTPIEVPPKTIQGFLLNADTNEPMTGQYTVVIGWDFESGQGPCDLSGNILFIEGKLEGSLNIADDGEFILQGIEPPLFVDKNFNFGEAAPDQSFTMTICGGTLQKPVSFQDESGKPMTFSIEEEKGVYLETAYVAP